ncbi:DUF1573 domain-containing protein [Rurimicrobium arvi]|uniref:DUF1573 domain-containing protein n=1 Tax=Rurimicrobium arvi TaxID=2049916 RepID=A0ABP8MFU1_9BACT
MKKVILSLCFAIGMAGVANAQNPVAAPAGATVDKNAPKFQFVDKNDTYDFGKIPEGPVAEHVFVFKNTGKKPLIISNANASCGCTTPEWNKEPIAPGKTGKITVRYNTQGRVGPIAKSVYITSNAAPVDGKERYELYIKGEVVPAAAPDAGK